MRSHHSIAAHRPPVLSYNPRSQQLKNLLDFSVWLIVGLAIGFRLMELA